MISYAKSFEQIEIENLPIEDGYCKHVNEYGDSCQTQCGGSYEEDSGFTHCPFCGKKIKYLNEVTVFVEPRLSSK